MRSSRRGKFRCRGPLTRRESGGAGFYDEAARGEGNSAVADRSRAGNPAEPDSITEIQ